jgi:YHS domain-containing protein
MLVRNLLQKSVLGVVALGLGLGGTLLAGEKKHSAAKEETYPLSVCVVTGEKLGSMGDPHVIKYQGREVKFCCAHCEKSFRKDPKKYLAKLDKAADSPATQPATRPAAPEADQ